MPSRISPIGYDGILPPLDNRAQIHVNRTDAAERRRGQPTNFGATVKINEYDSISRRCGWTAPYRCLALQDHSNLPEHRIARVLPPSRDRATPADHALRRQRSEGALRTHREMTELSRDSLRPRER